MNHDIRAIVGPILDHALETVRAPGEQFAWDIHTSLIAVGPTSSDIGIQTIVALSSPSPVIGESISTVKPVDLWSLTRGATALELMRELVDAVREMRARVLGSGNGPLRELRH